MATLRLAAVCADRRSWREGTEMRDGGNKEERIPEAVLYRGVPQLIKDKSLLPVAGSGPRKGDSDMHCASASCSRMLPLVSLPDRGTAAVPDRQLRRSNAGDKQRGQGRNISARATAESDGQDIVLAQRGEVIAMHRD